MNKSLDRILALIQNDPGGRGLRRDPNDNLITATTGDFERACLAIAEHTDPKIAIVTGFTIPSVDPPCGETDGPLGALYLARSLAPAGIAVTLVSDGSTLPALQAGINSTGLNQVTVIELADGHYEMDAGVYSSEFRDQCPPFNVLIALERVGPAFDNRCYSMRGCDMSHLTRPAHHLFEASRDYLTIGIGDGGNEIGIGRIPRSTIIRNITDGELVASRTETDYLVVAGVSNWGAYALAAAVRLLRRLPFDPSLFDLNRERDLLQVMIDAGPLVDGLTGHRTLTVDGLFFDDYVAALNSIGTYLSKSK
jgi:hypothetical protein